MRNLALTLLVLALVGGCNLGWIPGVSGPGGTVDNGNDNSPADTNSAALKTFESEDELKQYFASVAQNDFRGTDVLQEGDGNSAPTDGDSGALGGEGAAPISGDDSVALPEASDPNYSDTTTQEEGVQEADVVKNDGTYLYVLSSGWLRIVQAAPGEQLAEVAAVEMTGWGQDLYKLPADAAVATQIVAITQEDYWYAYADGEMATAQALDIAPPWFSSPKTVVTVFDVTDHTHPVVLSTTKLDGNMGSSRMIDSTLYLTMFNYPDYYSAFRFEEIDTVDIASLMPGYTVTLAGGTDASGELLSWDTIYHPTDPDGLGLTSIVAMDVGHPEALTAVGVLAYPGNLYASVNAIYLTDTSYMNATGEYRETTDIYKFAIVEGGVQLVATGSVAGRVLNQYSMSEYQGYLRVATTTGPSWMRDDEQPPVNNVYVLGQQGERLSVVGSVQDLAPGEEIKSARFIGSKGFLVTFEQMDPLFTFDLTIPTNPVKVGEWHGPGFSTFMIPIGESQLLAVGQAIDSQEGWPRPDGVQLSIFDVSNFAEPTLVSQRIIGSESTWSESLYNPKALTYFASRGLLAIPVTDWGWDEWGWDDGGVIGTEGNEGSGGSSGEGEAVDSQPPRAAQAEDVIEGGFDGVYVYQVSTESGFEYRGRLTTREEAADPWWYASAYTRGVFLGDNVFIVNERGVVGAPVSAVESAPWKVTFPFEDIFYPPDVIEEPAPVDGGDGQTEPGDAGDGTDPSAPDGGPVEDL